MSDGRMTLPMARGAGETSRRDLWWVQPLVVVTVFSSFIVYSTWAAFQNDHYTFGNYLSPMYSPVLVSEPTLAAKDDRTRPRAQEQMDHTFFGAKPGWWPAWLLFSPAFLILWAPGGFRLTCYYYRGAYYKAFWADPPNCSVGEPRKSYWGENHWPLLFQNIHRYFLYLAIIFIFLLAYDAIQGFLFPTDNGKRFGVGVGSFVLLLNVVLLGGYTFGCHSFRHLIGGGSDRLSDAPLGKKTYDCVSCLNRGHMAWAWCSLFWVAFSDIYVRLCSMGIWTDYRMVF